MKWIYGILIVGIISSLSGVFLKNEKTVLEEINYLKNVSPTIKLKVKLALKQSFTFLHVGDSHIQIGGFSKGFLDWLNQQQVAIPSIIHFPTTIFGDLHTPDFEIYTSGGTWQGTTLTNETNKELIGLSGRNFSFYGEHGTIEIKSKNKLKLIDKIALLHEKKEINFTCKHATINTTKINEQFYKTSFDFTKKQKKIKLKMNLPSGKIFKCYGILINEDPTKNNYYNAGVSGVKYLDFFKTKEFFKQLEWIQPTFLCLTLGTNDSYAPIIDTNTFENDLNLFITKIKKASPNTILLGMTTPDTYYMNQAPKYLEFINKTIRSVFTKQEVLLWDWYEIMGGDGAIQTWNKEKLVAPDLLHFNDKGYQLIGKSFAKAFLALQNE